MRGFGYGSEEGPWISVGIGIDAGIAFVGNIGSEGYVDFTALGDPVNTAARIQAEARSGELLMGEAVYQSVNEHYPGCDVRSVEVKGKQQAVHVHSIPLHTAT